MIVTAAVLAGAFAFLAAGTLMGRVKRSPRPARAGPPAGERRRLWLAQAGTGVTPVEFLAGSAGAAAAAFLAVLAMTGAPAVALVPALSVGLLPKAYFARRRAARMRDLAAAWPDGLRHIVGSVSSGLSLHQALCDLAESGPAPLRRAFARYPLTARIAGAVPAMEIIKEQLGEATADRVLEVLILAHERGGRMVPEVLRDLAGALTKDLKAGDEIETERLELKINSRAVFVLPWFVLVVLTATPGPFRDFYRSVPGLLVVALGGAMSLGGLWIVSRLGRDDPERRVFAPPAQDVP